ncbi:MAG: amylo-alpha-1,6-glucosidase [Nitrospira sp.]|jgi:predicted glycogen debranching enzyme|nr:glycogen debranching enzyme family protein [Nitrospira sp.]MDR4475696.1 amylo-alpha-1,6-glucosidase [Nitrospira sp.]
MTIDARGCRDLERALSLEWLEPNGRGGYASGTVAGANTRRYHALLLVARHPPVDRVALVNHVEESIEIGGDTCPLSTNVYGGAVHPEGYQYCERFSDVPWPTWRFACRGIRLERELVCPHGRDLVILRWRLLDDASPAVVLRVRPMLTGRDFHATHQENAALRSEATITGGQVLWQPYEGLPPVRAQHNGQYHHRPDWYRRIHYPVDRERGLEHVEDWWSPGECLFTLTPGTTAELVFTTETIPPLSVTQVMDAERRRRDTLVTSAPTEDELTHRLWVASNAFLVKRAARQTVIAGYPWFADWGRDTFVALPGLCLVTGRYEVARQVIEAFASYVSQGMVPNRFPDIGEQPEYNTIDASLWFIHTVDRYLYYSRDLVGVQRMAWPAVKQILDGYRQGTRFGIRMDEDGMITGGVEGVQLTWMDVKIGEWVVTPRHGKPVEIQALWVRALAVAAALAEQFGESAYAAQCRQDRARATASFRDRFWYRTGGYLFDVVDGPTGDDASLRPNQIFALALDDQLVTDAQAKQVLQLLKERLLTPVGLRTLAPEDIRFCASYEGGVAERDAAYHQGTVWPFLLGPFVTAWVKTYGDSPSVRRDARLFLQGLFEHLDEACLGQVSEIFDGERPHRARGCVAQAWSVAEPLRALIEDIAVTSEGVPVMR